MTTLVCVYCGIATFGSESLEHIVPALLGGESTLYPGAVCTQCNKRLGDNVDREIMKEPALAIGMVLAGVKGRRKDGKEYRLGQGFIRKTPDGVLVEKLTIGSTQNYYIISRAFAKIAVNILTEHYGSAVVRRDYPALISYVRNPKNRRDIWPLIGCITQLDSTIHYGLVSTDNPFIVKEPKYLFASVKCASGYFAIPLDRRSDVAFSEATNFIELVVNALGHGMAVFRWNVQNRER